MKKLILLLLICASVQGQIKFKDKETFNVSVVLDPKASFKEKALNLGLEIEYSGTVYARASVTTFSALKGEYYDFTGAFGGTLSLNKLEAYSGIRIGLIRRSTFTYPTYGLEVGLNYKLIDNLLVGIRSTYDYRSDFIFTGGEASFRYSGFIKIGYTWNYKNKNNEKITITCTTI
jgi:hypothetical protein